MKSVTRLFEFLIATSETVNSDFWLFSFTDSAEAWNNESRLCEFLFSSEASNTDLRSLQQRESTRKQGISPILMENPSTAGWNEAFHGVGTEAETESSKVSKMKQFCEVEEHKDSDAEASRYSSPTKSSSSPKKSSSSSSWSLFAQRYHSDTLSETIGSNRWRWSS